MLIGLQWPRATYSISDKIWNQSCVGALHRARKRTTWLKKGPYVSVFPSICSRTNRSTDLVLYLNNNNNRECCIWDWNDTIIHACNQWVHSSNKWGKLIQWHELVKIIAVKSDNKACPTMGNITPNTSQDVFHWSIQVVGWLGGRFVVKTCTNRTSFSTKLI